MNEERKLSYLEFKLNKELAYIDTFEKDELIEKEYQKYLKEYDRRKEKHSG